MPAAVLRAVILGAVLCLGLAPGLGHADQDRSLRDCVTLPLVVGNALDKPGWLDDLLSGAAQYRLEQAIVVISGKASAGDDFARIILGDLAERGACVPADPGLARQLYADVTRSPSRKLRVAASFLLGGMMERGLGGSKSVSDARELYRRAMLDGRLKEDPNWAITEQVVMLNRPESPLLAQEHAELISVLSNAQTAQTLSAYFGSETPLDATLSCSVLYSAKERTPAMDFRLAWFHLGNAGLSESRRWAWFFLSNASVEGHPDAVRTGVRLLLEGDPFPPQPGLALTWILQAQERGIAIDERDLAEARSRLSRDEQKLAEENAFIFRPLALPAELKGIVVRHLHEHPICSIS